MNLDFESPDALAETEFEGLGMERKSPRHAAVLLPLYRHDGQWNLLYIRRAEHKDDRHSGQVAFPGGRTEKSDRDDVATALREAREEIGLASEQVRILGRLRVLHTVSNYLVTPVVATIPWPVPLTPDENEVARVFGIPIDWHRRPEHHQVRVWPGPGHPEARDVIFFDRYDSEQLWGITARITLNLLNRIADQ